MKPELTPLSRTRNAGKPLIFGSVSTATRRSAIEPISAKRKRTLIGGQCNRFRMEIAAGNHFVCFRKHERIVGDGIGLDLQCAARKAQKIEHRAHYLRLTAQRIRILHAVTIDMRLPNGASRKQRAQRRCRFDLALLSAQFMQPRIERRIAALHRIGRNRAGYKRACEHVLRCE